MDKATILKLFLTRGTQIDQGALDFLVNNQSTLETILKLDKTKLPPVITVDFLKSILSISSIGIGQEISINQLSQIVNYRYGFLKKILETKEELVNLVSINKISEKMKHFSVIGVVLEKSDTVVLEDTTGQATFILDKEMSKFVVEDEVLGFVCEQQYGVNIVKHIVYPDIPLNRESKKTESSEKCFFVSDIHMDSTTFNKNYYKNLLEWLNKQDNLKIFVLGGISSKKEDTSKFLSDIPHPAYFWYENNAKKPTTKQMDDVQLLLSYDSFLQYYMKLWNISIDTTIVNLLRKRNLNPILTPENYNNSFLLEEVPDVIAISGTNKATLTNYKGTTIITTGSFTTEPIYWLINLQTRETFKINFS